MAVYDSRDIGEERSFSLPYTPNFEFIETDEEAEKAALELQKFKVLSVDTETTGLDPYTCRLLLIQIATPDKCYIINCAKVNPGVWNSILSDRTILKIVQNAKFDYKMLRVHTGVSMRSIFDTMIAERLLTVGKQRKTSLQYMASKYLSLDLDKEIRRDFIGIYRDRFSRAELLYAANDALILHEIYNIQIDALERDGLLVVAQLEFNTIVPLSEMELRGCLIDVSKWRSLVATAKKNRQESEKIVKALLKPVCSQLTIFGESTINVSSQKQLLVHLHKLGIHVEDTSEETLKKVDHEVAKHLVAWRGWEKICTSYGEKFLQKINSKTGRLHAQFNQVRADTGRMSSSKPNLQQILGFIEDDINSLNFRSCFVASPGYKLVTCDFSQQELRILAESSGDKNLINAFLNDEDIHTRTAIFIFGGTPEEVKANGKRNIAKTINFLISYGGSSYTLAARLGISEDEAESFIQGYFKSFPGIRDFINKYGTKAVQNGYSTTVSGRRRYYNIPSFEDEDYKKQVSAIKRKGVNAIIQGSAADVSKQALCNFFYAVEQKGYDAHLQMIVHDEIVVEVKEEQAEEVALLLEKSMIKGFTDFFKKVPMKADACIDSSWHH